MDSQEDGKLRRVATDVLTKVFVFFGGVLVLASTRSFSHRRPWRHCLELSFAKHEVERQTSSLLQTYCPAALRAYLQDGILQKETVRSHKEGANAERRANSAGHHS